MKNKFKPGDSKFYTTNVKEEDVASFYGDIVHPVCSTFSLARYIEWATRQYVLEIKEEDEEGIGTFLSIEHVSPAVPGNELLIYSEVIKWEDGELICRYEVKVNDRLIARGETGQKVLKKEKIDKIFSSLPR